MYYTTPVYQFRMKCHLCDNYFVIKTDPAVSAAGCLAGCGGGCVVRGTTKSIVCCNNI